VPITIKQFSEVPHHSNRNRPRTPEQQQQPHLAPSPADLPCHLEGWNAQDENSSKIAHQNIAAHIKH
jgi:hypothetical protein